MEASGGLHRSSGIKPTAHSARHGVIPTSSSTIPGGSGHPRPRGLLELGQRVVPNGSSYQMSNSSRRPAAP
jgi:hypothetical protein